MSSSAPPLDASVSDSLLPSPEDEIQLLSTNYSDPYSALARRVSTAFTLLQLQHPALAEKELSEGMRLIETLETYMVTPSLTVSPKEAA